MKNTISAFILLMCVCAKLSGQLKSSLELIYSENSVEKLRAYFNGWAEEVKPISDKELRSQKEYVKATYAIFEVFFNPHNIGKLGVKQNRYDIYRNYHYFVIPQKIGIYTAEKVYYNEEETQAYTIDAIKNMLSQIA